MIYNLGRVAPIFRGNYKPTQEYGILDIVYYDGASFVALMDKLKNIAPTREDNPYWAIVADSNAFDADALQEVLTTRGFVVDANYIHTDENFTSELKAKLENFDYNDLNNKPVLHNGVGGDVTLMWGEGSEFESSLGDIHANL